VWHYPFERDSLGLVAFELARDGLWPRLPPNDDACHIKAIAARHRFAQELDRRRSVQYRVVSGDEPPDSLARRIDQNRELEPQAIARPQHIDETPEGIKYYPQQLDWQCQQPEHETPRSWSHSSVARSAAKRGASTGCAGF
jgi:hypothetical protein